MDKFLKSITNTKTIIAILAQVIIIGQALQINVDWSVVEVVVTATCSILVLLGVINSDGMDTTKMNK